MVNYLELPIGERSPEVFRAVIEEFTYRIEE